MAPVAPPSSAPLCMYHEQLHDDYSSKMLKLTVFRKTSAMSLKN